MKQDIKIHYSTKTNILVLLFFFIIGNLFSQKEIYQCDCKQNAEVEYVIVKDSIIEFFNDCIFFTYNIYNKNIKLIDSFKLASKNDSVFMLTKSMNIEYVYSLKENCYNCLRNYKIDLIGNLITNQIIINYQNENLYYITFDLRPMVSSFRYIYSFMTDQNLNILMIGFYDGYSNYKCFNKDGYKYRTIFKIMK